MEDGNIAKSISDVNSLPTFMFDLASTITRQPKLQVTFTSRHYVFLQIRKCVVVVTTVVSDIVQCWWRGADWPE